MATSRGLEISGSDQQVGQVYELAIAGKNNELETLIKANPEILELQDEGDTALGILVRQVVPAQLAVEECIRDAASIYDIYDDADTEKSAYAKSREKIIENISVLKKIKAAIVLVLKLGANPNIKMSSLSQVAGEYIELSPLHYLASHGINDLLQIFATHPQIDLESVDEHGATALHVAVSVQQVQSIKILLAAGANINALFRDDEHSLSPLDLAELRKNDLSKAISEMLKEHGGITAAELLAEPTLYANARVLAPRDARPTLPPTEALQLD